LKIREAHFSEEPSKIARQREVMKKVLGLFVVMLTAGLAVSFADPGPGKALVILGIVVSLGALLIMVKLVKFFWYFLEKKEAERERCLAR